MSLFLPWARGWMLLTKAIDAALVACPRRWRFGLALALSRPLRPLVRLRSPYQKEFWYLDDHREEALRFTLERLNYLGVGYDPALSVRGADAIGEGGAIIITGHFFLNRLFTRWLFERGRNVTAVMAKPPQRLRIMGTSAPLDVIKLSPTVLVRVRRRADEGKLVMLYLDPLRPRAGARRIETPRRARYVNDSVMRFAERAGISVLFCSTHLGTDGRVTVNVARPSSQSAAVVHEEFCQFLHDAAQPHTR